MTTIMATTLTTSNAQTTTRTTLMSHANSVLSLLKNGGQLGTCEKKGEAVVID